MEALSLEEAKEALSNDNICRQLGAAIVKSNSSRNWYVEVHDKGRLATIKIPELSMEYGVIIHLTGGLIDDCKKAVMAAGELLERFNLTRERSDNHDLMSLERNHKGVIGAKKGEAV